ncbi:fasciclin domain-containing protein [Sphingobacterium chuzhouense]|uniref:Fasciclin domain-containing protein n=1 Tax=Sphingobacterium chuzhouense TaxID=1742264 RepID=A0ABR7XMS4_9SPHI|nr:fasciclin domain-containing protein [Sphingobacterium chuzhouense]MBD1420476.1 fasciclin domain-containing protein [Sphingobacterium chuzhouense]
MKQIIYTAVCLLTILTSCQKSWNSHYGEEEATVSSLNLLDYLKSQPQYSSFVAKLEEYGLAEELSRDQNLTIWAVSNEKMAALNSLGEDSKFILRYHINSLTYDNTKLKSGLRVMTFNGKYLTIDKEGTMVRVGDATVVKGNQLCKNGVVHEIDQLLSPDWSIYEYLEGLGHDYSIIRDTILAMNDTIFDLENSIPIGVDPTGNTVYDSVYVITNPVFEKANIRSEFANVTMFLPSNAVIEDCFENLGVLYDQFGKEFLETDSLKAYTWIKEAIFYNRLVEDVTEGDITSAFGRLWKPSVQLVDSDFKRMSNGRIYEVTHLKIPNNIHIDMIKQLFHYWEFVPDAEKEALFTLNNVTGIRPHDETTVTFPTIGVELTYRTLRIEGGLIEGQPISIEFTPIMLERHPDGSTGYKVVEVPPGEYNLYMGFHASNHPFVNIYVDNKPVAQKLNVEPATPWNYDRNTNVVPGTRYNGWGGLVAPVMIEGDEVRSFKIKVEFAGLGKGKVESIIPYHWTLVPTENNY